MGSPPLSESLGDATPGSPASVAAAAARSKEVSRDTMARNGYRGSEVSSANSVRCGSPTLAECGTRSGTSVAQCFFVFFLLIGL